MIIQYQWTLTQCTKNHAVEATTHVVRVEAMHVEHVVDALVVLHVTLSVIIATKKGILRKIAIKSNVMKCNVKSTLFSKL